MRTKMNSTIPTFHFQDQEVACHFTKVRTRLKRQSQDSSGLDSKLELLLVLVTA